MVSPYHFDIRNLKDIKVFLYILVGVSTVWSTMSRGVNENNQLKTKLETQLSRLLDQLHDIETTKDSLDEDEYLDLKNDTLEQVLIIAMDH